MKLKIKAFLVTILLSFSCNTTGVHWTLEKLKNENYQEIKFFYDKKSTLIGQPDKFPMYPDGLQGFLNDIKRATRYPPSEKREGIQGEVVVRYSIGHKGKITDITIVKSLSRGLDREVVRVLRTLKKKWFPGLINGHPVKVTFLQTFTFSIE